eukprot:CAMPEP_0180159676 /NCGR_PEP_ID=MMETSP0986-20121125/27662_1 /TAXON_ID=697907 /ORGANISM="non described non described, Strain CCMP2293" /LENGTH=30 /DNA_ID= /DNA_START= /DNA_END= /DNA_ORIENTATION=
MTATRVYRGTSLIRNRLPHKTMRHSPTVGS